MSGAGSPERSQQPPVAAAAPGMLVDEEDDDEVPPIVAPAAAETTAPQDDDGAATPADDVAAAAADEEEPAAAPALMNTEDRSWLATEGADAVLLNRERLHAAYLRFFLQGPAPPEADDDGDDDDDARLGGDTDDELDELKAAAMRHARDENASDDEDGDDWDAMLEQAENEDDRRFAGGRKVDDDFMNWISAYDPGKDVAAPGRGDADDDDANALVRRQLQERGLGGDDVAAVARGDKHLPERLEQLKQTAGELVGAVPSATLDQPPAEDDGMPGVAAFTALTRKQEIVWIVDRLVTSVGLPLFRRRMDAALAKSVAAEVEIAVSLMVDKGYEPAHLAIYHRFHFPTIRSMLWEHTDGVGADASMPYCAVTGRRIQPCTPGSEYDRIRRAPTFVDGGGAEGKETAWREMNYTEGVNDIVGKPTDVRLGRFLWHVAEQHARCVAIEKQRRDLHHRLLDAFSVEATAPLARRMDEHLLRGPFTDSHQPAMWRQFADWARSQTTTFASADLRGYGPTLAEFAGDLSGLAVSVLNSQFHGFRPRPREFDPKAWAAAHVQGEGTADEVLELCKKAIADVLVLLPTLRQRAVDEYLKSGILDVRNVGAAITPFPRFINIASIIASPIAFLELLEREAAKTVRFELVLSQGALRTALNIDSWVRSNAGGDDVAPFFEAWHDLFDSVATLVVRRIASHAEVHVRNMLRQAGEQQHIDQVVRRLGGFCQEGPYEHTELRLEAIDSTAPLWEAAHDVVEAVPPKGREHQNRRSAPLQVPTVGAYVAPNGSTFFSLVDELGMLRECVRWANFTPGSADSDREIAKQQEELVVAVRKYSPRVFAVAVSGGAAEMRLFNQLRKFVRDVLSVRFGYTIDVVWQSPTIAAVAARSVAAGTDMPGRADAYVMAACVARTCQNPLHSVARLFDSQQTARGLPIDIERFHRAGRHGGRIYRWMMWELSLWVTAAGVDVNMLLTGTHAELVLQFVAGLGIIRARSLAMELLRVGGQIDSRATIQAALQQTSEDQRTAVIARNAVPSLRVVLMDKVPDDVSNFHPLDATLIPPEWYGDVAALLCGADAQLPSAVKPLIVWQAMNTSNVAEFIWRDVLQGIPFAFEMPLHAQDSIRSYYLDEIAPNDTMLHQAAFIVDQLTAGSRSTMLRPYRHVTAERFFELTTNLTYTHRNLASTGAAVDARTVYRGCRVEGSIQRYLVRDKAVSLVVQLSIGVSGTIDANDISNQAIRTSLEEFAVRARDFKMRRDRPAELGLGIGDTIFARVNGVVYDRCELKLLWEDPPSSDELTAMASAAGRSNSSYAGTSRHSDLGNTVVTEALIKRGATTALSFVRHPLFRELTAAQVKDHMSLPDQPVGEVLIRSSHVGGRAFVITVKVAEGDDCTFNIPCTEVRNPDGKHVYRIDNSRIKSAAAGGHRGSVTLYDSVDHILKTIVEPISRFVRSIRTHRKFLTTQELAREALVAQLHDNSECLAYAVVPRVDERYSSTYAIVFQTMDLDRPRTMPIVFLGDQLGYVTKVGVVPCRNISEVIQRFKEEHTRLPGERQEHPGARQQQQYARSAASSGASSRGSLRSGGGNW